MKHNAPWSPPLPRRQRWWRWRTRPCQAYVHTSSGPARPIEPGAAPPARPGARARLRGDGTTEDQPAGGGGGGASRPTLYAPD